ncbi:unnamed protein product [Adineta steineri]|uniref:Uncharacterized protein n=1 Tax=Adineta steineri TaxID=433720 RepID=A0A815QAN8_9BILA|nr:unnamed protein product [Adineta steineri]
MNANNNSHEEILQLSSQDVSGHKDEPSNIQQQQQIKKKKCRGNRKEQRNRKRLCRQQQQQQINANTIRMVQDTINNDDADSQSQQNQV